MIGGQKGELHMIKKEKQTSIKISNILMNNKALFILLFLCICSAILSDTFLTGTNILNVIRQVSASAIVSVGFTCVIASGNFDLSVGYMLGMLGVIIALLSKTGMPFPAALLLGLLCGAVCGALNGFVGVQFKLPLFIVTLAIGQIFKGIDYLLSNTSPISSLPTAFKTIGSGYLGPIPIPIYVTLAVAIIVSVILNKTIFGRQLVAIGGNREAARTSGINVKWVTIRVYILMGICTAVGAIIMTGRANSAQPNAGHGMEMDAIAAVVIGGTPLSGGSGKVSGTIFGCLIVGVIANVLNLMGVDTNWQLIAKGLLIIFAVGLDVFTTAYITRSSKKVM